MAITTSPGARQTQAESHPGVPGSRHGLVVLLPSGSSREFRTRHGDTGRREVSPPRLHASLPAIPIHGRPDAFEVERGLRVGDPLPQCELPPSNVSPATELVPHLAIDPDRRDLVNRPDSISKPDLTNRRDLTNRHDLTNRRDLTNRHDLESKQA